MTPDRRVYRIRRQRVAAGGTVTVMTDVTEQKQAERDLMQERDGLRVLIDLTKQDKSEMIAVLEEVLSQLKN